jgi:hypothetical protein
MVATAAAGWLATRDRRLARDSRQCGTKTGLPHGRERNRQELVTCAYRDACLSSCGEREKSCVVKFYNGAAGAGN